MAVIEKDNMMVQDGRFTPVTPGEVLVNSEADLDELAGRVYPGTVAYTANQAQRWQLGPDGAWARYPAAVYPQADWNTTDPSSNRYIRNKPDVKLRQAAVPDPEASEEKSTTFIDSVTQDENGVITATKKTMAAQVQADWSQTSLVAPDYIKHKPTVKTIQVTVSDPTALNETSTTFISNISQNGNGVITPTKKKLPPIPDLSQSLTVGSTTVTEAQLQALLALLN